ncbi:MAG TPA: iron-sulfur cluster assembly scaffold protein [bacterium]|nr:iron-sulfur cluster assembly scaffold protein [bacterium]
MDFPYSEKVLEHFKDPQNVGEIENADGKAQEGSPACGDMVSVHIKLDDDKKHIQDIKFKSYGCASNIATGSIITELAKGKTIDEAKQISWQEASDALGGLPPIKTHCSVLAVDGLRAAIENYEEKSGLKTEQAPTDLAFIHKKLKRVMNPIAGIDIVKSDLVNNVSLDDGVVKIDVDLAANHQFANNIDEEIREKLEPIHDIEKVEVNFLR